MIIASIASKIKNSKITIANYFREKRRLVRAAKKLED